MTCRCKNCKYCNNNNNHDTDYNTNNKKITEDNCTSIKHGNATVKDHSNYDCYYEYCQNCRYKKQNIFARDKQRITSTNVTSELSLYRARLIKENESVDCGNIGKRIIKK